MTTSADNKVELDWSDYATVPDVAPDAVVDPHWQDIRTELLLPAIYLPSAMGGNHKGWVRWSVWMMVFVFLTATSLGICLTYGPGF